MLQNEQVEDDLRIWAQVYGLASKHGIAQVLWALENLAQQLELPDGLKSFERFLGNDDSD